MNSLTVTIRARAGEAEIYGLDANGRTVVLLSWQIVEEGGNFSGLIGAAEPGTLAMLFQDIRSSIDKLREE